MTTKKTILVVDDHEDDRILLEQLFKSLGYKVLLATNGEIAQETLTTQHVDLVFSDVLMPIMDGLQLCKMIKTSNALKNIPVILYTSIYTNEEDMKQAIKIGADQYLTKPIKPDNLLTVLQQSINKIPPKKESDNKEPPPPASESKEQYLRLYSTQLVQRLEKEVDKLGAEITKRKNVEKEQGEILNSMIDGVITIDETGNILTFNKAAEILFGYKTKDVTGKNVKMLMPEPYTSQHDDYIQRYRDTGEAHIINIGTGREVKGLRSNKETFPMRLLVAELPKAADNRRRFIGSCQDLTFIRQQEEQLRRSQKMDALGKLTGGIAHDYNNMLGVIIGYANLLENALRDKPKLEKYANQILYAGERGAKLTKKLLAFSRQKSSSAEILDLNAMLLDEEHMLEKTLTARINLKLNLADNLWPVLLDSGDLEDAIINISINAMHAMKGNGQLTIRTENTKFNTQDAQLLNLESGDYVLLSITDTGCGMDADTKDKIFDPFFSTKGKRGTGLGLSQVYGFTERSSGMIKVYSEPGHGSCFSLYFPRSRKPDRVDTQVVTDTEKKNLQGSETLLVVDDEPALVELAKEILTTQGYRVLTANDGKQALLMLEKEKVDLIISDIIMPNMDGYQLAAQVQQDYPHIKIQMVSGFSDSRHSNMADNDLYQHMMYKPYAFNTLLTHVRNLLDKDTKPQSPPTSPPTSPSTLKNKLANFTILVMDDEEDVRELFQLNLERLGYQTLLACNGAEAIALYQQSLESGAPINAIILDLSIPGSLGGKEVAAKIRSLNVNAKIIVASGDSGGPEMTHYQDYGFDGALEKTFDRKKIKQALEKVLLF
jgi:PAS domain S-box-containing protein